MTETAAAESAPAPAPRRRERIIPRSWIAAVAAAAVLAAGYVIATQPAPYVVEEPGPLFNALGSAGGDRLVTVDGARTTPDYGTIDILTVRVEGSPLNRINWFQAATAAVSGGNAVIPYYEAYPPGRDLTAAGQAAVAQMAQSQTSAGIAAARLAGVARPSAVRLSAALGDVSGPSAGLALGLAAYSMMTDGNLSGGGALAATGTIDAAGSVGRIGGTVPKLTAAAAAGTRWAIIPRGNCADIGDAAPGGISVVAVSSLREAVAAAKRIAAHTQRAGITGCSA